jgi:uncharacterized protein
MKRQLTDYLKIWLSSPSRKPLLVKGARQVGKTYLIKDFARSTKRVTHYIDFRNQRELQNVFINSKNFQELFRLLQLALGRRIHPEADILLLDELQECPGGVPSLKYFADELPTLPVIAAGSHLGLTKNEDPFPVGKVQFANLAPLTFTEFLLACDPLLADEYWQLNIKGASVIPQLVHTKLSDMLLYYFIVGGMPEVVATFKDSYPDNLVTAYKRIRELQLALEEGYKGDFVKYAGKVNATHLLQVFESIPRQLGKALDSSVAKYIFTGVISNQKGFSRLRGPLEWLKTAQLCIPSYICSKAEHPLAGFTHENQFKLYFFDVGLLHSMLRVPIEAILAEKLGSYKGYLAENFIAQQLYAVHNTSVVSPLHCLFEGSSEIEFLLPNGSDIIPIEVKSATRSRRSKSLTAFCERYNPHIAYKLTNQNIGFAEQRRILTLPLYLIERIV